MADTETEVIQLELDTQDAELVIENLTEGLDSLRSLAADIGREMAKAFAPLQKNLQKVETGISGMTDALTNASTAIQEVLDELDASHMLDTIGTVVDSLALMLEWILHLGDLGSVLSAVSAWITGTLVPAITGAFGAIGSAISAAAAAMGVSVGGFIAITAAAVAAIVAAVVVVVKNWDQISLAFTTFFTETLPQLWAQFTQWVSGIAVSVAEVFSAVMASIVGFFTEAWNWLVTTFAGIGQWVQENVIQPIIAFFTPLVEWFAALFGSIQQTISDVFYNIGVIATGCWEILQAVWGVVAEWFNANVIEPVVAFFGSLWESVSALASGAWEGIKGVFTTVAEWFSQYVIQPVTDFFTGLWDGVKNAAAQAWEGIKSVFGNVASFFGEIFSDAWAKVVAVFSIAGDIFVNIRDGILTAFKKIVNGIITGINRVVRIPFDGINSALSRLRGISILGISPFTGLGSISVPQIPYLAQGAVLPANKPFMAVVGDQRHGTNVEAPLTTIQEAVAVVMGDQIGAMMAGFQALLEEQRATRQAVESIEVGDEIIANAVTRHKRKQAMLCGI